MSSPPPPDENPPGDDVPHKQRSSSASSLTSPPVAPSRPRKRKRDDARTFRPDPCLDDGDPESELEPTAAPTTSSSVAIPNSGSLHPPKRVKLTLPLHVPLRAVAPLGSVSGESELPESQHVDPSDAQVDVKRKPKKPKKILIDGMETVTNQTAASPVSPVIAPGKVPSICSEEKSRQQTPSRPPPHRLDDSPTGGRVIGSAKSSQKEREQSRSQPQVPLSAVSFGALGSENSSAAAHKIPKEVVISGGRLPPLFRPIERAPSFDPRAEAELSTDEEEPDERDFNGGSRRSPIPRRRHFSKLPLEKQYRYVVHSTVLSSVLSHALADPRNEIIGVLGGTFVKASRLVFVRMTYACTRPIGKLSRFSVEANSEDIAQAALLFEKNGFFNVGWYHSHPGGLKSHPSDQDIQMQKQYQLNGKHCLGMICAPAWPFRLTKSRNRRNERYLNRKLRSSCFHNIVDNEKEIETNFRFFRVEPIERFLPNGLDHDWVRARHLIRNEGWVTPRTTLEMQRTLGVSLVETRRMRRFDLANERYRLIGTDEDRSAVIDRYAYQVACQKYLTSFLRSHVITARMGLINDERNIARHSMHLKCVIRRLRASCREKGLTVLSFKEFVANPVSSELRRSLAPEPSFIETPRTQLNVDLEERPAARRPAVVVPRFEPPPPFYYQIHVDRGDVDFDQTREGGQKIKVFVLRFTVLGRCFAPGHKVRFRTMGTGTGFKFGFSGHVQGAFMNFSEWENEDATRPDFVEFQEMSNCPFGRSRLHVLVAGKVNALFPISRMIPE